MNPGLKQNRDPSSSVTAKLDANAHYIQSDLLRYQSDLRPWVSRVGGTASPAEALDRARHPPPPPPVIRGLTALYSSDVHRAEGQIDLALYQKLHRLAPGDERDRCVARAMRLTWAQRTHGWARRLHTEARAARRA